MFVHPETLHVIPLLDLPPSKICYAIYRKDQDVMPDSPIGICLRKLCELAEENHWIEKLCFPICLPDSSRNITKAVSVFQSLFFLIK